MKAKKKAWNKKRTWHYLYEPVAYEICCEVDGKLNKDHKVTWSEFEGKIWCYDCQKDMVGFKGIFGGPIPYEATKMLLGNLCFHRYNMKTKVIEYPVLAKGGGKMYYRVDKALTKKILLARMEKGEKKKK